VCYAPKLSKDECLALRQNSTASESSPQWFFSEAPGSDTVLPRRHGTSGGGKKVMHWRKLLSARVDANQALLQKSRDDKRKPAPAVMTRRRVEQPTNAKTADVGHTKSVAKRRASDTEENRQRRVRQHKAHARAKAHGQGTAQESMHTREDSCETDNDWTDSYYDDCTLYVEYPSWCETAEIFADENGEDATDKCCVCKIFANSFANNSHCNASSSDYEWVDNSDDGCKFYEDYPLWCMSADMFSNDDGSNAVDKCCVCQSYVPDENDDGDDTCSEEQPCAGLGLFCNFVDGASGSCNPCSQCPTCSACGLSEAGLQSCSNICTDNSTSSDSDMCTFMGFKCNNITSGGWGINAATVCDPDKGSLYVCDNAADSGTHASVACSDTCANVFGCKWIENNINTAGEMYVGEVSNEAECIQLVRDQCPSATIANLGVSSSSCWCQYGTDLTPVSGAGCKNCLLSSIYGMLTQTHARTVFHGH